MEHWELEARECIRDLVARYNSNGDSGRFEAVLALFTEDAVMELPDATHAGRAALRAMFTGVSGDTGGDSARAKFIRHFTSTHQIDVAGPDVASGRCYYVVFTERGADHWGRYVDDYRRVAGRWLFARRRVSVDAMAAGGWAEGRLGQSD